MIINIITNTSNEHGLKKDTEILIGLLTISIPDVKIRKNHWQLSPPKEADLNIFIEVFNPIWITYAGKNILIPNQEWFHKNWIEHLPTIDEIWCKSHYAESLFKELGANTRYIGWTSLDYGYNDTKEDYALMIVGRNIRRAVSEVINAWDFEFPNLKVVWDSKYINLEIPPKKGIIPFESYVDEETLHKLRKNATYFIGLTSADGFHHAQNEARSVGSIIISSNDPPMNEFSSSSYGLQIDSSSCNSREDYLGTLSVYNSETIHSKLEEFFKINAKTKKAMIEASRNAYEKNHSEFMERMKGVIGELYTAWDIEGSFKRNIWKNQEELPTVSLLTPTKDRRNFMDLAKHCFLMQNYPRNKLEWLIYDDSDISCRDAVEGLDEENIKFFWDPPIDPEKGETRTLAQKRNFLCSKATGSILLNMDDDDYYPPNSTLFRVLSLLWFKETYGVECAFCTAIPMYHTTKFTSAMNIPPAMIPTAERVSEATLTFTKNFWNERKFADKDNVGEGCNFIKGREVQCRQLDPMQTIVSLLHAKNTSSRTLPPGVPEKNGCHYGFTNELFMLITKIGEDMQGHPIELTESEIKAAEQAETS